MSTDDGPRWLTAADGDVEVVDEVDGRAPWPRSALPWKPIPDAGAVLDHVSEGAAAPLEDLAAFVDGQVVLPEPRGGWSVLLAAWTLGTYLLEAFAYFPVLLFQGPPERGKTRCGKAVLWPAFRGYFTASPTAATLFRDRAFHRCTLMLDVEDVEDVLDRSDLGDLVLTGFERGGVIRRCTHPDAEPREQVETFAAYGATILTSNTPIRADRPLASRCLPVRLPEARGANVPEPATPEEVADLRARATAWAASRHAWRDTLPEVELDLRGRMADLSKPLVRLVEAVAPDLRPDLTDLLRRLDRERREEASESWEARVAVALWDAYQAKPEHKRNGRVYIEEVGKIANDGRPEGEKLTAQQVGIARRKLGLRKGRGGARGKTFIVWPGEREARQLRDRYTTPSAEDPERCSGSSAPSDTPDRMGGLRSEHLAEHPEGLQQSLQRQDPGGVGTTEHPEHPEHPRGADSKGGGGGGGSAHTCSECGDPIGPTADVCGRCKAGGES